MAEAKSQFDLEMETDALPASWPSMITDEDRSQAEKAMSEFKSKNYSGCLATLGTLATSRSHDHKIMLNRAVAEYYKSGLTKTNEFRRALNEISSKVNFEEVYDIDQSLLLYNQAVVLFYARQYLAAFSIMEKLIPLLEDMSTFFPYAPSCFIIDLHISSLRPDRALAFIETHGITDTKSGSLERDEGQKEDATHGQASSQNLEKWKVTVGQYRTRCYLMLRLIKPAKSTLKVPSNMAEMTPSIVFLRSQFELIRGNHQKAARILTSAPELLSARIGCGTPLMLMYYNNMAVIHLNMQKPNLALFYLQEAVERNNAYENEMKKAYSKENAAADLSKGTLPSWPLQSLSGSQYSVLMYNMGITLLHCGHFQQAFNCLLEAVKIYSSNPRLWLRLAECCVMANRQSNDEDCKIERKLEVVERAVGSGVHRKLIFGCGVAKEQTNSANDMGAMPMARMEFASLCLDNALLCLDTAAKIPFDTAGPVHCPPSKQDNSETSKPSPSQSFFIQAPPGNPLTADEVANLRCSLLALKSYVSLYLNDHLVSLSCAEELLRQPRLSGAHRYLAHMYKAEALVALDRISDAIQNLNPDNITDVSSSPSNEQTAPSDKTDKNSERGASEPPEDKRTSYPWYPKDLTEAKGIMMYNLAATYAIRGEFEKASAHLNLSKGKLNKPRPAHISYLKIYLELMQGHSKVAQGFVKRQFGHMDVKIP